MNKCKRTLCCWKPRTFIGSFSDRHACNYWGLGFPFGKDCNLSAEKRLIITEHVTGAGPLPIFSCLLSSSYLIHLNVPVLTSLMSPFLKKNFFIWKINLIQLQKLGSSLFRFWVFPYFSTLLSAHFLKNENASHQPSTVQLRVCAFSCRFLCLSRCLPPHGVQAAALRWPRAMGWGREGGSRAEGCTYNCGQFVLLCGRANTTL